MSKNIADLYNEVMSSQAATAEKTASAQNDTSFDASFFEKVASGDEEAVGALNAFIDEARSEGHSDEEIEAAIGEAMNDAGIDLGEDVGDDDFEMAKSAAYEEGVQMAINDMMQKAASLGVTEEEMAQYHIGVAQGQGYAETRSALEEVVEKIAAAKIAAKKAPPGLFKAMGSHVSGARDTLADRIASGMQKHMPGRYSGSTAKNRKLIERRSRQLANLGMGAAGAGTAAGIAGAGAAGGYAAGRKQK